MKEFKIKYYKRDFRSQVLDKDAPYAHFEILYRQDAIKNPFRLKSGEPAGPWYGFGMEKKVVYIYDERENKQVYTHRKNRNVFRPDNVQETEQEILFKQEELYKPATPTSN
jgi:hypothetical protein